ncbi:MAG: sigma-54-dependent Fis family transcriptional regulator [Desulfobacterales bacterium]|uniref:Sigma-54-dependent Fis family transcriptional regulator n=1 Tax=Candidatus Desulfaltia bathyphila TaxID=2841697 RepID=A0A8J6TC49_9BACT|nr:sigma-54-dependent Fis family transcriptional regulator [Candidatus Desulfaltia bathyphila]MBL7194744.1 sigma-54-dependent Fis family transcriptional regulator [Desulfobacterales bacterium]MBL7206960.1 sigma-54-dependent Fis family transcriptional regulator [Desulfobacterales bacterium]
MAKILVVDDDPSMREFLEILLTTEGYEVTSASGGKEALGLCKKHKFDLAITDLKMPKVDGIDVLKTIREISPETMVILITAFASGETAIAAMKEGAYDYLEKNFDVEDLKAVIKDALSKKGVKEEDAVFMKDVEDALSFGDMIGKSKGMLKVYSLVKKVADTTANVLITGESGTGKELVARAIHENSPRKDKSFVVINCGGIPENLLESELFGYMKGAFSGAHADKPGLFEVAHMGTIFLDEIGELPPFLQVKLLRVVQEKTFRRIGGTEDVKVDVRIISATNQDLAQKVKNGGFREDLYYRLNVIPVEIPPLRERNEDIPLLTNYFIEKYSKEFGKEIKKISPYALMLLMKYRFPGNVRELENIIERSVALETTNIILPENLVISGTGGSDEDTVLNAVISEEGISLNEELARIEGLLIKKALQKTNGSKTKAARLLNISFDSLRYRLEKLDI